MPEYFTPELFRYLARLKRNNKRDWFLAHQDEFESCVRQPALRFITEFAVPLAEIAPYLNADPRPSRGSLFRIYRDVRFSADKRPYKTHVAMRFSHRGKDVHSPGFYLHLEPGGSFAACVFGTRNRRPCSKFETPSWRGPTSGARFAGFLIGTTPVNCNARPAASLLIMNL